MKTSPFFKNLYALYVAEIDDLSTDSSGADVLQKRLKEKRQQLAQLMPMAAFSPEMVAPALHGAFRFSKPRTWEQAVRNDELSLPSWASLANSVSVADWAQPLLATILAAPGGEDFLVQAAALEFLTQHGNSHSAAAPAEAEERDNREDRSHRHDLGEHNRDDDHGDDVDLAEAGNDWMAEQGFDNLG